MRRFTIMALLMMSLFFGFTQPNADTRENNQESKPFVGLCECKLSCPIQIQGQDVANLANSVASRAPAPSLDDMAPKYYANEESCEKELKPSDEKSICRIHCLDQRSKKKEEFLSHSNQSEPGQQDTKTLFDLLTLHVSSKCLPWKQNDSRQLKDFSQIEIPSTDFQRNTIATSQQEMIPICLVDSLSSMNEDLLNLFVDTLYVGGLIANDSLASEHASGVVAALCNFLTIPTCSVPGYTVTKPDQDEDILIVRHSVTNTEWKIKNLNSPNESLGVDFGY